MKKFNDISINVIKDLRKDYEKGRTKAANNVCSVVQVSVPKAK